MPKRHSPGGCTCCGGSTGPVHIAGCACTGSPTTLTMSVSAPDQTPPFDTLRSCTLVYGPTPGCYAALSLPPNGYFSTASFIDGSTGDTYQYYYYCFTSFYAVTRVYCTSAFGSPYRDIIRYRWFIGSAPNQCSGPYQMHAGTLYLGGFISCVVHID